MNFQDVIKNEIKNIIVNADEEDITEKLAFMYYCFEKTEDINPNEVLEICLEDFPKLKIGIDGFFLNVDDTTINFYEVIYNSNASDNEKIGKREFQSTLDKGINTIKMVVDKNIKIDESSYTYSFLEEAISKIKTHEIILNIYTNYDVPESYLTEDIREYKEVSYGIKVVDYETLVSKNGNKDDLYKINLKDRFGFDFSAVKISSTDDFDIYMTSVPGNMLADLYKVDSVRLLESNVRSYLKKTSRVNKGIYATVKDCPEEFAAYNNGLATVATNADVIKLNDYFYRIKALTNWQIVNGGQTTATLYECYKDKLDLDEIVVPCKLTVLKNVDDPQTLISNISTYSNTQTAIKKSDPPSNLKYYIDIKQLSDNTWASKNGKSYLCFFERTNGEYNTAKRRNNFSASFNNKYPQKHKFTKLDLAKVIVCWEQHPDIANLGSEKNFEYFNNIVKDQLNEVDSEYYKKSYALIILYREMDKIIRRKKTTSYKSTVITYGISLLSLLTNKHFDLLSIWDNQALSQQQENCINALIDKIIIKLNGVPSGTDVRMWARKTSCWDALKTIQIHIDPSLSTAETVFFVENEPKIWIENPSNLKNPKTWEDLLAWNNEREVLKQKERNMIQGMRVNTSIGRTVTNAQKDYAIAIFMKAIKAGYTHKKY